MGGSPCAYVSSVLSLVVIAGCSGASGSLGSPSCDAATCQAYDCDAGACQTLGSEIVAHLPPGRSAAGICNNPPPNLATACADYAQCMQQCGH
jgi:hypothetical protein